MQWHSPRRGSAPVSFLLPAFLVLAALELQHVPPETALWTTPAVLLAAMMIAWAAESAQFFVAQGFALAILAWLQTLPEFAVEAVLAWKQQVPLLLANLTGALRLLTGLGWPMIYFTAATFHRLRYKTPLRQIALEDEHCVEVLGLIPPLFYMLFVWWKSSLNVFDAIVLIAMYCGYLWVLAKLPPQESEGIDELERIPKAIVTSTPRVRNAWIVGLFLAGGALIYFSAEPFLASLLALAAILGVPNFVFVQWVAPFVSEFPEKISAFYWARTIHRASMALMNMVSSNINQWTLLAAMLPLVYSLSRGEASTIGFDGQQETELLMTVGQSMTGVIFLMKMRLVWWQAASLFGLWFFQFAVSPLSPERMGSWGFLVEHIHWYVTLGYLAWAAVGAVLLIMRPREAKAVHLFAKVWREHVARP